MNFAVIDNETMAYIRGDSEFRRARMRNFWQGLYGLVTGKDNRLIPFNDLAEANTLGQPTNLGLRDVSLKVIVGSVDRAQDFSRRFAPRSNSREMNERWRNIYTLAVTGKGFPPVELYKVGDDYFVKDGHHRISVATHLGWKSIQAYVTEILL